MKKKPSMIFSILINTLNNLKQNEEYSINEISEKSGLHWQTANEYLRTLLYLFKFSPKFIINDKDKIEIINHSEVYKDLSKSQKILLYLYESKAFNPDTSISLDDYFESNDLETYVEELIAKEQIERIPEEEQYFLTKAGKLLVISIYSRIEKSLFDLKNMGINVKDESEAKIDAESLFKQNQEIKRRLDNIQKILLDKIPF
jgi:predicted transcriptional regulator